MNMSGNIQDRWGPEMKLGQEFVDRMTSGDDDGPAVIGGSPAPMPTQAEAEQAWRRAFIARMVERGVDVEDATACCEANSFNSPFGWELLEDPAHAADDEIACWDSE